MIQRAHRERVGRLGPEGTAGQHSLLSWTGRVTKDMGRPDRKRKQQRRQFKPPRLKDLEADITTWSHGAGWAQKPDFQTFCFIVSLMRYWQLQKLCTHSNSRTHNLSFSCQLEIYRAHFSSPAHTNNCESLLACLGFLYFSTFVSCVLWKKTWRHSFTHCIYVCLL